MGLPEGGAEAGSGVEREGQLRRGHLYDVVAAAAGAKYAENEVTACNFLAATLCTELRQRGQQGGETGAETGL